MIFKLPPIFAPPPVFPTGFTGLESVPPLTNPCGEYQAISVAMASSPVDPGNEKRISGTRPGLVKRFGRGLERLFGRGPKGVLATQTKEIAEDLPPDVADQVTLKLSVEETIRVRQSLPKLIFFYKGVLAPPTIVDSWKDGVIEIGRFLAEENGRWGISDLSVSHTHASLSYRDGQVFLKDCGSQNGTFLNGARLPAEESFMLVEGDSLRFGEVEFSVSSRSGLGARQSMLSPDALPTPHFIVADTEEGILRREENPFAHMQNVTFEETPDQLIVTDRRGGKTSQIEINVVTMEMSLNRVVQVREEGLALFAVRHGDILMALYCGDALFIHPQAIGLHALAEKPLIQRRLMERVVAAQSWRELVKSVSDLLKISHPLVKLLHQIQFGSVSHLTLPEE